MNHILNIEVKLYVSVHRWKRVESVPVSIRALLYPWGRDDEG